MRKTLFDLGSNAAAEAAPAIPADDMGVGGASVWPPAIAIFILLLMATVAYLDRQIISLLVAPMKEGLDISDLQVGALMGMAFGLFYALFGMPLGGLVDRYSPRAVIFWGITVWSLAAMSCGLARSFGELFIARMIVGVGEACLMPAAFAIIGGIVQPRRMAISISIFAMGATIGSALAILIGGQVIGSLEKVGMVALPLIGYRQPWQVVFLLTGLPGLLIAPLAFLLPRIDVRRHGAVARERLAPFLLEHRRYLTGIILGYGMALILAYGLASWFPTYLIRNFGLSISTAATLFVFSSAPFSLLGFILPSYFVDRCFGAGRADAHLRYGLFACVLMTVLALCCFGLAPGLYPTLAIVAAINFLFPMNGIIAAHLQLATPPALRGRVSALMILGSNVLGLTLGPTIVSLLTDEVFGDPGQLGTSIALVFLVFGPLGATLFFFGMPGARAAIGLNR